MISLDFCMAEPPHFFGPFKTNHERYLTLIDGVLGCHSASRDEVPGDRAEGSREMYDTHLWLREVISDLQELRVEEPTYIKHADDKGDQILVDAQHNVVGIIDWEW